jgi:hypothetical protein
MYSYVSSKHSKMHKTKIRTFVQIRLQVHEYQCSEFQPSMFIHFNTIFLTLCDWFWQIRITRRITDLWQQVPDGSFPPLLCYCTAHSWLSQALSLTKGDCWLLCFMEWDGLSINECILLFQKCFCFIKIHFYDFLGYFMFFNANN